MVTIPVKQELFFLLLVQPRIKRSVAADADDYFNDIVKGIQRKIHYNTPRAISSLRNCLKSWFLIWSPINP